jgi:hypothetical protein
MLPVRCGNFGSYWGEATGNYINDLMRGQRKKTQNHFVDANTMV